MTKRSIHCLLSVVLILGLLIPRTSAHASSLVVNSLADQIKVDSQCTLREAIQNANSNTATNVDCAAGSGADTITFSISGVITLGSILPTIADSSGLTLDGSGQDVTISGNHAVKIAVLQPGASLTLDHLTIADGSTNSIGGAISNSATLVITNSTFSGNNATLYYAGGIYNTGTLTISNSTFISNSAVRGGGGIYNDGGALTVSNSVFSGNTTSGGRGGGIYVLSGNVNITDSRFTGNSANLGSGGAIRNDAGTLTISNGTFSNNAANYGNGGAIFNDYSTTIRLSTFTGNSADSGGGIYNSGPYFTVVNSTFSGNSAVINGGGMLNNEHGEATVLNSTFSNNSSPGDDGGLGNASGKVTLRNTLLANNTGGNCSGVITNGGSNLDDGVTCNWGSVAGSLSNTDPLLGALTGSPAYYPLNPGSPAIDRGDDPTCMVWPVSNQSQNGATRPQGVHCDIGSYELALIYFKICLPLVMK